MKIILTPTKNDLRRVLLALDGATKTDPKLATIHERWLAKLRKAPHNRHRHV